MSALNKCGIAGFRRGNFNPLLKKTAFFSYRVKKTCFCMDFLLYLLMMEQSSGTFQNQERGNAKKILSVYVD